MGCRAYWFPLVAAGLLACLGVQGASPSLRPVEDLPSGFEAYDPNVKYELATSSDGKYKGLLNTKTRLWAYGTGSFLQDQATNSVSSPKGYVAANGAVWGPVIQKADGTFLPMSYNQAMTCCNGPRQAGYPASCPFGQGGARLPSIEQARTLGRELGLGGPLGYNPSLVPGLSYNTPFWTSEFPAYFSVTFSDVHGHDAIEHDGDFGVANFAALCVVDKHSPPLPGQNVRSPNYDPNSDLPPTTPPYGSSDSPEGRKAYLQYQMDYGRWAYKHPGAAYQIQRARSGAQWSGYNRGWGR